METIALTVDGMTCGGCVASVTRLLQATPGVTDAVVELTARRATVTFDPARTSVAALKAVIDDGGYAAS